MILLLGELARADGSERAYDAVYDAWTEELKLYDGLATALIVRATYHSDALNRAETARWALLTAADAAAADARIAAAPVEHVVRFTAASQWQGDLSFGTDADGQAARTGWGMRFSAAGHPCDGPASFTRVARPTALDRALSPRMTPWDQLWEARFSRQGCEDAGEWTLEIGGAHGRGTLRWSAHDGD